MGIYMFISQILTFYTRRMLQSKIVPNIEIFREITHVPLPSTEYKTLTCVTIHELDVSYRSRDSVSLHSLDSVSLGNWLRVPLYGAPLFISKLLM